MGLFQNLQKLLSDFSCRRSKINGGKSNLMLLDHNGLVKERPPRPEVIKELAKVMAADPDVLFRLSSSTDPEVVSYLHDQPEVMNLLRYIKKASFTEDEITSLIQAAESIKANSH
jgi:hypothetical protein